MVSEHRTVFQEVRVRCVTPNNSIYSVPGDTEQECSVKFAFWHSGTMVQHPRDGHNSKRQMDEEEMEERWMEGSCHPESFCHLCTQ